MPGRIIWNDELDNALRKLIASGAGRDLIEEEMGFSWPTLRRRLRKLEVDVHPSRQIRPETLRGIALVEQGLSGAEAARQVGLSRSAVTAAIRRRKARNG